MVKQCSCSDSPLLFSTNSTILSSLAHLTPHTFHDSQPNSTHHCCLKANDSIFDWLMCCMLSSSTTVHTHYFFYAWFKNLYLVEKYVLRWVRLSLDDPWFGCLTINLVSIGIKAFEFRVFTLLFSSIVQELEVLKQQSFCVKSLSFAVFYCWE